METQKDEKNFEQVSCVVTSLAKKFNCSRQYVRRVLKGRSKMSTSIKALKIKEDAKAIEDILERDTKITI